jgi:uncharacterized protein YacL
MMNPFKEVNWKPDVAERRKFARSLVIGFPCIAMVLIVASWLKTGAWKIQPALIIGGTGLVIGLVLLALPGIARPFYVIWYGLACAIGLIVGNILLAVVFYILITGVGIAMRLVGRCSISTRMDKQAATYWKDAKPVTDPQRYYRQF